MTPTLDAHYCAHVKYSQPYRQALAIQRILFSDIEAQGTKPIERAQLARAWETLENRKRILRGRGLPKPVDGAKPKQRAANAEPVPSE